MIATFAVDGHIPLGVSLITDAYRSLLTEIKCRHLGSSYTTITVESLYYYEYMAAKPYKILLRNTQSGRYSLYAFSSSSFVSGILSTIQWYNSSVKITRIWDGMGQDVYPLFS